MLVGRAVSHMGWRQRNNQLAHKQVPWRKWGSCHAVKRAVAAVARLDTMEAPVTSSCYSVVCNFGLKR